MPKKRASAVLIILFLFSIMGTVFASTEGAGVKEGDIYSYDVQFSSNVPSLTNLDLRRMVAMSITVTRVDADEIEYQSTVIFNNGTESTADNSELYSKESPYVNWYLFYPANLSASDPVSIFGEHYPITETVLRNYAGVERETNRLAIELTGLNTSSIPEYHEYYDVYFDKKTGMAVELHIEQVNSDEELLNDYNAHNQRIERVDSSRVPISNCYFNINDRSIGWVNNLQKNSCGSSPTPDAPQC